MTIEIGEVELQVLRVLALENGVSPERVASVLLSIALAGPHLQSDEEGHLIQLPRTCTLVRHQCPQ